MYAKNMCLPPKSILLQKSDQYIPGHWFGWTLDVAELAEEDDSDETHQYGFLEAGMNPAREAYGRVTVSVGSLSPPFLPPLPL